MLNVVLTVPLMDLALRPQFMHDNNLQPDTQRRLRDYFHRCYHLWAADSQRVVLQKMSPSLQSEVALKVNSSWLDKVPWLCSETDPDFLIEIVLTIRPAVFAPKEIIRESALHVISHGGAS